jgi:transposase InsO family protein
MKAVEALVNTTSIVEACDALSLPRASYYRWRGGPAGEEKPRPTPPRALTESERKRVLETLNSPRFVDQSPREIWATLLDEETYFCSVRTMYRILKTAHLVRERRNHLRHPHYKKPELLATAPNQVWSWDITKLLGPAKWMYYYLYVILDIYSRYVVGWMLAHRESADLARRLIHETVAKESVDPKQLTIHADRGPSPASKLVAQFLADLGVTKTHSRPYTSNDNPYSEAQFRTLKYRPAFPDCFGSFEHGHAFSQDFFAWYNHEHHHVGIGLMTPADVHHGRAPAILARRQNVLQAAYDAHPERFVRKHPVPPPLPEAAWINPPARREREDKRQVVIH